MRHRLYVLLPLLTLSVTCLIPSADAQLSERRVRDKRELVSDHCPGLPADIVKVLAERPVVDTHAHTFNLGHLPVEGLLYRFRFPSGLALPLAEMFNALVDDTPLSDEEGRGETTGTVADIRTVLDQEQRDLLIEKKRKIYKAIRRGTEDTGPTVEVEPPPDNLDDDEEARQILLDVSQAITHQEHDEGPSFSRDENLVTFLRTLLKREDEVARSLADDHRLVDVFVHHMMDMDNVYHHSERSKVTFDPNQRLKRMRELDALTAGSEISTRFTVAFDPFRAGALEHIEKGIEGGALAVKFYPPSGYRPSANVIPPKPKYFIKSFPWIYLPPTARKAQRKQWRHRYPDGRGSEAEAHLNRTVLKMFQKAHAEEVPIFSHHTPVGFEASTSYGRQMAEPCRWKEILDREDLGNGTLRLVLGHSGGGDAWFAKETKHGKVGWEGSFDQQAYNLCVQYPNVYCDLGYFVEVLDDQKRALFTEKLNVLIAERQHRDAHESWDVDACSTQQNAPPKYRFEDKILFGTDWFMISKEKHQEEMVCAFARALADLPEGIRSEVARGFFGANAFKAFPRL